MTRTELRIAVFDATASHPDTIARLYADVVCVFGAPRLLRWRSRTAAIARRNGLVYVTGQGTVLLSSHRLLVTACANSKVPPVTAAVFRTASRRLVVGALRSGDVAAAQHWLGVLGDEHDAPQLLAGDGWHASPDVELRRLDDGAALVTL